MQERYRVSPWRLLMLWLCGVGFGMGAFAYGVTRSSDLLIFLGLTYVAAILNAVIVAKDAGTVREDEGES